MDRFQLQLHIEMLPKSLKLTSHIKSVLENYRANSISLLTATQRINNVIHDYTERHLLSNLLIKIYTSRENN